MKSCCKSAEVDAGARKRSPLLWILGVVAVVIVGVLVAGGASAQDGHGHGHDGQKSEKATPTDYAGAVRAIDARMKNIARLIETKKLDAVHAEAEVIRDVAKSVAQLALKADSGVPKEAVKEINLAAKALADKFEPIDAAGDSGNLEVTKKVYQEMVTLQATLQKYVPATYQCPMKCEGDKTYPKPGDCPVCKMHLKKLSSDAFTVEVKPSEALQPGKPASLTLSVRDPSGQPAKQFEKVHEMFMHVLAVSKDLSWFAHEHPELQKDGTFKLSLAFPSAGEYVLYHDFTPPAVGQQVVSVPLTVPGQAAVPVALKVDIDKPKLVDGYTVAFKATGPIQTEQESELVFEIARDGKPVADLEPYLGAMGHFVIISQDLKSFVHSHPHEEGEEAGGHGHGESGHDSKPHAAEKGGPDVHFHARFEAPGVYKGWGQFQHKGKVLTVPVVFEVKEGHGAPAKEGGGHKH